MINNKGKGNLFKRKYIMYAYYLYNKSCCFVHLTIHSGRSVLLRISFKMPLF